MEGNLVADEDLGKQSIVRQKKSWMRNRKWRSVLSATYVLTFNDEEKVEDEAAADTRTKPPLNWQDETENKQE
jgi:nitroimidazol reductase NimA-like FMN-containing flavoprotein (pyridoxamine 5'-phosphate oxidase superfamily)